MVVAFELKEIDLQKLSWWIFLESSASLPFSFFFFSTELSQLLGFNTNSLSTSSRLNSVANFRFYVKSILVILKPQK